MSKITKDTMTLAHIARNGSYLGLGKTDEEKLKLRETAKFIIERADILGIDLEEDVWIKWKDEAAEDLIHDRATLFARIIALSENKKGLCDDELDSIFRPIDIAHVSNGVKALANKSKEELLERNLKQVKADLAKVTSRIQILNENLEDEYSSLHYFNNKYTSLIRDIEDIHDEEIEGSGSPTKLLPIPSDNINWKLVDINTDVDDRTLSYKFISRHNCKLRYYNALAGIDRTKNMGQFLLVITNDLIRADGDNHKYKIKIYPFKNNLCKDNYYHPHIGTSGSPCLGNAFDRINNYLSNDDYNSALNIIWDYLQVYNPDSPYKQFKFFTQELPQYIIENCLSNYLPQYIAYKQRQAAIENINEDNEVEHD